MRERGRKRRERKRGRERNENSEQTRSFVISKFEKGMDKMISSLIHAFTYIFNTYMCIFIQLNPNGP